MTTRGARDFVNNFRILLFFFLSFKPFVRDQRVASTHGNVTCTQYDIIMIRFFLYTFPEDKTRPETVADAVLATTRYGRTTETRDERRQAAGPSLGGGGGGGGGGVVGDAA